MTHKGRHFGASLAIDYSPVPRPFNSLGLQSLCLIVFWDHKILMVVNILLALEYVFLETSFFACRPKVRNLSRPRRWPALKQCATTFFVLYRLIFLDASDNLDKFL